MEKMIDMAGEGRWMGIRRRWEEKRAKGAAFDIPIEHISICKKIIYYIGTVPMIDQFK